MHENSNLTKKNSNTSNSENYNNDDNCAVGVDVLEFVDRLNRNVDSNRGYDSWCKSFITNEEDYSSASYSLKLVNSELFSYMEKEIKIPPLAENEEELKNFYAPGIDINFRTLFPRQSVLTKSEQHLLYHFLCRNVYKNKPLNESEAIQFHALVTKVNEDIKEFQDFVKLQWIKHHCVRSLNIPSEIEQYINRLWEFRAGQSLVMYPELYKSLNCLPLVLNDPNKDFAVLEFCRCLKIVGKPLRMSLPNLKTRCDLISDFSRMCQIKPISVQEDAVKSIMNKIMPASADPNIEHMLQEENIDIVITSCGIKNIVDVTKESVKEWTLPVTIKDVFNIDGDTKKKVVIIDKHLPASAMSAHDKTIWHAKIMAKWSLILNENPHLFDKELPISKSHKEDHEKSKTNVDDLGKNINIDDNFKGEVNTVTEEPKELSKSGNNLKGRKQLKSCHNSTSEPQPGKAGPSGLSTTERTVTHYDDFIIEDCENFGIDPGPDIGTKKNTTAKKSDVDSGERKLTNTRETKKNGPLNPCVFYNLWNLHKSHHFNMSKQEQRSLNILVRNRLDGKLSYYSENSNCVSDVCISSKVEFQPEYGASLLEESELIKEYADLYLRQKAKLVRVRSIGHTKELMLTEVKTISDIREALLVKNVQSKKLFDPLYAILTKLIDLPVGKYLLQRTAKMGFFVQLYVESDESTSFNLPKYCHELQPADVNVPPTLIDPFVLTALHHREKLPPAVFTPAFNVNRTNFLQKPARPPIVKKNRKRNKKKTTK